MQQSDVARMVHLQPEIQSLDPWLPGLVYLTLEGNIQLGLLSLCFDVLYPLVCLEFRFFRDILIDDGVCIILL